MESNNDKQKITLNRKMRLWNKYRNYVIGLAVVVVLAVIFVVVLKSCSQKKDDKGETVTKAPVVTQEQTTAEKETASAQESKADAAEATTNASTAASAASTGSSLKVTGTPEVQDNTSSDFYKNAMFIGDFVISGISEFGIASDSQVIASNSMTSDKMSGYMDEFVAGSPDSIYIMVGINDLAYGSRSAEDIYDYEKEFIEELKSKLPNTKVCVLSVLPVSEKFESSSKVKQADIDELNNLFSENAASLGITYVDVASAFKDGTGYFGSSYTDSGYNLKSGYYAFMLNGIAGVVK